MKTKDKLLLNNTKLKIPFKREEPGFGMLHRIYSLHFQQCCSFQTIFLVFWKESPCSCQTLCFSFELACLQDL